MHTVHSSLYALILAACLLCFFIVRGGKERRVTYLLVFLALEAFRFKLEWLMLHPTLFGKSLWLGLLLLSSLWVAPCLWLLTRELTEDATPSWRSLPGAHVLVIAVGMLCTLPLISTAHWGATYADPNSSLGSLELKVVQGGMIVAALLFLAQVPFYCSKCVRLIGEQTNRAHILFSNIESARLNALRILILVVAIQWGVSLLRVLHCMLLGEDTGLGVYFAAVQVGFTLWALVAVMLRTTVFSADDRQLLAELTGASTEGAPVPAQYAKSPLTDAIRQRIASKLKRVLEEEQLYRHGSLNLRGLCAHVSESPHYVSQVINQEFTTTFYGLINRYRVEAAKTMLTQTPDATVVEVAMAVGFNSKSTFNAAFRRQTQTTPTAFRDTHLTLPQSPSVGVTAGGDSDR